MIFRIALRNIIRNKRRSILTAITIGVGLAFYIYVDSLMSGMNRDVLENMVYLTDAAIKIHSPEYDQNKDSFPLKYGIKNYEEIVSRLKDDERITGVTGRTLFMGEVSDYRDSLPVLGIAVYPELEKEVYTLSEFIVEGRYFDPDAGNQILIGQRLAAEFGLKAGDFIALSALNVYDYQNIDDFKIVGIFNCPSYALNSGTVYIPYKAADELLDLDGLITEITAGVNWPKGQSFDDYSERVSKIAKDIYLRKAGTKITTIIDSAKEYLAVVESKDASKYIIMLIFLIIGAVGIINTVMMSVYERIREVGVLRALGFSSEQIFRMFMLEGVFIGIIGGIFSTILGVLINIWLVYTGIDMDIYRVGDTTGLALGEAICGQWNPSSFVFVFVFGIVVALLASIIPARKAIKLQVTSALRFQ